MKNILKIIVLVLAVKVVFFFMAPTVVANNKKPAIERFVNEFIINNPNVTYPVQVDALTTLTSRELVKKGQVKKSEFVCGGDSWQVGEYWVQEHKKAGRTILTCQCEHYSKFPNENAIL